jgi:hypothetical protein
MIENDNVNDLEFNLFLNAFTRLFTIENDFARLHFIDFNSLEKESTNLNTRLQFLEGGFYNV